ncbi:peptidylprolyl isomerase [Desulfurispora thermophila]|uniref:peptidylprolyl isomerase n=1 Tax=Desulfurispora thermophila TaxID=265470 RepID=UPI00037F6E3D|nr:peptidylprolyl isomerase [Desulfurispora thermophila]
MPKKYPRLLAALLGLALLVLAGCSNNTVATVNGTPITATQLDEKVEQMKKQYAQMGLSFDGEQAKPLLDMLRRQTLQQLIDRELLLQKAKEWKISPTDKEVDEALKKFRQQFKDDAEFKKYLAANGFSEPKLRDAVRESLVMDKMQQKVLADLKQPSEAEAQSYYNAHKEQYQVPAQYQVRHILITAGGSDGGTAQDRAKAKATALQLIAQLKNGADFAELAKKYSQDPGSASNGGLYTFKKGDAVPEFEKAALALKPGEITTQPVQTEYGYHIIKKEKDIAGKQMTFAEVKDEIIQQLHSEAAQKKLDEFMQELRKAAKIENKLPEAGEQQQSGGSEQKKK